MSGRRHHEATVVAYSAHPSDERLTLMIECWECPQAPLRWGHTSDADGAYSRLRDEARTHNHEMSGGSTEQGGK